MVRRQPLVGGFECSGGWRESVSRVSGDRRGQPDRQSGTNGVGPVAGNFPGRKDTAVYEKKGISSPGGDLYKVRIDYNLRPTEQPRRIPTGSLRFYRGMWTADGKELLVY